MKIVYTEQEVLDLLTKQLSDVSPEGKVPSVSIANYSSDYCTVVFIDDPNADKAVDGPELPPEDKPIDLSEIPF